MTNIRNLLSLALLLAAAAGFAQDSAQSELTLDRLPNEAWWGGAVTLGTKMPYGVAPLDINLDGDNRGNQYAPLLVSTKGRYVWCEKAFRFAFQDQTLRVTSPGSTFRYGQAGQNLRDAYRYAAKSFFPTDGSDQGPTRVWNATVWLLTFARNVPDADVGVVRWA